MSVETAQSADVRLTIENRIATITIDRPKALNALNHSVFAELDRLTPRLADDRDVAGIILTGGGEKAFVAGADIKELADLDTAGGYRTSRFGQGVMRRFECLPKPSVAAVNGYALGGGLELALSCSLRIASDTAKLGMPEVSLGLIPGYAGTQRLARLIGMGRTLELILTGTPVDAQEALRIGIVNRVVPAGELLDESRKLLDTILSRGPLAVAAALEVVRSGLDCSFDAGQELESQAFGRLFGTKDMHEGVDAFLAKRKPDFSAS
jgi:enoyl-CoA hydratase